MNKLLLVLVLGSLAGCTTFNGRDGNNQWTASAYTLGNCQAKLDQEAGHHLQLTGHVQQIAMSVLNFGITPAYVCWGDEKTTPTATAATQ
jgi:hypothetical protein